MATLKELTWEFHKNAERQDFARKLLKGELTEEQYAEYLFNQHHIYNELETWARKANLLKGIEDICRTEAIIKDRTQLMYGGFKLTRTATKYGHWVHHLYTYKPELLMAHIYVRHFGDLHGGQMIARRVPGNGEYYKFKDGERLITKVRSRLEGKEDLYKDEAIKCFEFATQLFKELSGE